MHLLKVNYVIYYIFIVSGKKLKKPFEDEVVKEAKKIIDQQSDDEASTDDEDNENVNISSGNKTRISRLENNDRLNKYIGRPTNVPPHQHATKKIPGKKTAEPNGRENKMPRKKMEIKPTFKVNMKSNASNYKKSFKPIKDLAKVEDVRSDYKRLESKGVQFVKPKTMNGKKLGRSPTVEAQENRDKINKNNVEKDMVDSGLIDIKSHGLDNVDKTNLESQSNRSTDLKNCHNSGKYRSESEDTYHNELELEKNSRVNKEPQEMAATNNNPSESVNSYIEKRDLKDFETEQKEAQLEGESEEAQNFSNMHTEEATVNCSVGDTGENKNMEDTHDTEVLMQDHLKTLKDLDKDNRNQHRSPNPLSETENECNKNSQEDVRAANKEEDNNTSNEITNPNSLRNDKKDPEVGSKELINKEDFHLQKGDKTKKQQDNKASPASAGKIKSVSKEPVSASPKISLDINSNSNLDNKKDDKLQERILASAKGNIEKKKAPSADIKKRKKSSDKPKKEEKIFQKPEKKQLEGKGGNQSTKKQSMVDRISQVKEKPKDHKPSTSHDSSQSSKPMNFEDRSKESMVLPKKDMDSDRIDLDSLDLGYSDEETEDIFERAKRKYGIQLDSDED